MLNQYGIQIFGMQYALFPLSLSFFFYIVANNFIFFIFFIYFIFVHLLHDKHWAKHVIYLILQRSPKKKMLCLC